MGVVSFSHLDSIWPGRPVEKGYIESFNGTLHGDCLNVEVVFNLADERQKLYLWWRDHNTSILAPRWLTTSLRVSGNMGGRRFT